MAVNPVVLIFILFGTVLATAVFFAVLIRRHSWKEGHLTRPLPARLWPRESPWLFENPRCWLAIKSRDPAEVQSALGLHHTLPCSWAEGIERVAEEKLFISPAAEGWILVFGSGLPEPAEDVDAFYRFILGLSRKLGLVLFFGAHRAVYHHAWIKVLDGRVVRAYAWAEETLWNQGDLTQAERDLGFQCRPYAAKLDANRMNLREQNRANCEKVSLLAALWSVDPKSVDGKWFSEQLGIAGELSHPKLH